MCKWFYCHYQSLEKNSFIIIIIIVLLFYSSFIINVKILKLIINKSQKCVNKQIAY
jgi:hypothetical protein